MTALPKGRHPQWLAERNRLFAVANAADCPSVEFDKADDAMRGLEQAIIWTCATSHAEAAAKLRFCAVINAEGSVLDRDDAGDLMADIAPFLAPEVDREAWDVAKAAYTAAKAIEAAFDAENCSIPDNIPDGPERTAAFNTIPASIWDESQRLGDIVSDAEDVLMDIPSPDIAAHFFKRLVAHGDGRETDCWNAMLDAEAKRFAGENL
jgi:hypothetical protein